MATPYDTDSSEWKQFTGPFPRDGNGWGAVSTGWKLLGGVSIEWKQSQQIARARNGSRGDVGHSRMRCRTLLITIAKGVRPPRAPTKRGHRLLWE